MRTRETKPTGSQSEKVLHDNNMGAEIVACFETVVNTPDCLCNRLPQLLAAGLLAQDVLPT